MQIMTSKTIFNSLPNIIGSQLQEDLRTSPKNGTYERLNLVTESLLEPLITANKQCFERPKATTIVIFNGLNSSVRSLVLKRFLFVYKHGQCHSTKPWILNFDFIHGKYHQTFLKFKNITQERWIIELEPISVWHCFLETSSATAEIDGGTHSASTLSWSSTIYVTVC